MEELIFFAVIIFFSILESIARSRKGKAGGEADGPLPDPVEWETRLPDLEPGRSSGGGDEAEAYDDDPSYDDVALGRRQDREDRTLERYKASGLPRMAPVVISSTEGTEDSKK